jgi:hypothetical protein
MMRAMLRWAVTIILPVFLAYYWNAFELVISKAVLGVLAVLVSNLCGASESMCVPFKRQGLLGLWGGTPFLLLWVNLLKK